MLFFEELCSRLGIDWNSISSNDLFSETELTRWLTLAKDEACSRHPWPFTEGKRNISSVSGQEQYDYPTDMKSDSVRYLTVNDERYDKILFEDYLRYKEDYASGTAKLFSDYSRTLYVNCLVDGFGGSITAYGIVEITGSVSSATSSTVFSIAEPEGDEAIVKLAHAKALASDKKKDPQRARIERTEALAILDEIWQKIREKQHTYQTKDKKLFSDFNVLEGELEDELNNPLQF